MKTKTILFTMTIIIFLIAVAGCDKKNEDLDYYSGEVVSLNKGDGCMDIIEIKQSPRKGLPVETRITFNSRASERELGIGDIVRFRINYYEKWTGPADTYCMWPYYAANVELVSN